MSGAPDATALLRTLRAAHVRGATRATLLATACERIRAWGAPFTSVYAYLLQGDSLVLEAYAGRATEHRRIPVGTGVCGTAIARGQDQNVADVRTVENYLACNLETQSELVVLIRRGAAVLGQLDVDSDVPAGFSEDHHRAVKEVADALAVLL